MIVAELSQRPSPRQARLLLENIVFSDPLTIEEQMQWNQLLIPDISGILRPVNKVFFDDIHTAATFLLTGGKKYPTHAGISRLLANRLRLSILSDIRSDCIGLEDEEDFSQAEDFTTRIRGVLRDYDIAYSFSEFVANADDAKATEVTFMLDEASHPAEHLLAPQLAQFQRGPALLIHNNAVFTDDDFRGLKDVGMGSKIDQLDKIGRMGLGALSMYHFTQVPTLLSGNRIVILDPSREHLPRSVRGSRGGVWWKLGGLQK